MKVCSKCNELKQLNLFNKRTRNKDGRRADCKSCQRNDNMRYRRDNPEKCREQGRRWRQANPEKVNELARNFRKKNKNYITYIRNWEAKNPEKTAEMKAKHGKKSAKKYRESHPERLRYSESMRRGQKLNATPNWLSQEQKNYIKQFYKARKELSLFYGIVYHVDHIEPLKGATSCGLHVPWNLQLLSSEENQKKYNKLI